MTMSAPSAPSVISPDTCPFWSVMIPSYRPNEAFLGETLHGVLRQAPPPERMQIAVVDDCTPDQDVRAMVARLAGSRVQFFQTPRNLGLAGCWNACVAHARGEWTHLLHQDDLVYPGFYSELESLITKWPEAGAAFTRHAYADRAGHWLSLSDLESPGAGPLAGWPEKLAGWQRVECASIVVRRAAYAAVGPFRDDLAYVLDWEMWARLAQKYSCLYSPAILAAYRLHADSETSRLRKSGETLRETLRGFEVILEHVPSAQRVAVTDEFNRRFAQRVWEQAFALFATGEPRQARTLLATHSGRFPRSRRSERWFLQARCLLKEWRT